ncbi:hypothetical protein ADEAN_000142400 [Angomonas deanei]|uniref:Uncharacterized protein n=1 Tax=Angomonas deanei TaxID=59799 RepID=A0A7G2C2L4_9TRYP|nr:hypothetical protein ADEAN_000142400 [Angomonas deanei]
MGNGCSRHHPVVVQPISPPPSEEEEEERNQEYSYVTSVTTLAQSDTQTPERVSRCDTDNRISTILRKERDRQPPKAPVNRYILPTALPPTSPDEDAVQPLNPQDLLSLTTSEVGELDSFLGSMSGIGPQPLPKFSAPKAEPPQAVKLMTDFFPPMRKPAKLNSLFTNNNNKVIIIVRTRSGCDAIQTI